MRKLIVAFLILTVVCPAFAEEFTFYNFKKKAAAGGGGGAGYACDSTTDASLICEDIESTSLCATGYDNSCRLTWTVDVLTATIDFTDPHPNTMPCTDKGSNSIEFRYDGTSGDARQATIVHTYTSSADSYMRGWFNIQAARVNALTFEAGIYYSSAEPLCILQVNRGASDILPSIRGRNAAGTPTTWQTDNTALSVNTWYEFTLEHHSGSCELKITGGATLTQTTDVQTGMSSALIKVGNTASGAPYLFNFDNIKINAASMPAACPQ